MAKTNQHRPKRLPLRSYVRLRILKLGGYQFVSVIRHESHDGKPVVEALYRNSGGKERRLIVAGQVKVECLQ